MTTLPVAATLVLVRDGTDGDLEVLLVKRPHSGSFANAWVFPGGRVEPEDRDGSDPDDELGAARRAAVRETAEETGLAVAVGGLAHLSVWLPPIEAPARFHTWFFLALAPEGEGAVDGRELVDLAWLAPSEALARHGRGEMELAAPTFVTLHGLGRHRRAADVVARTASEGPRHFETRSVPVGDVPIVVWDGDVAYDDVTLVDADGGRHRLVRSGLPWSYERRP
jgi:8-oxo-dGTP pyrophosphatase MutT (NUDIX family)